MKTNAARLLGTLGVAYELREYDPASGDRKCDTVPLKEVQGAIAKPKDA